MLSILQSEIYFSYSQVLVFDVSAEAEAGLNWTEAHVSQGFARRQSAVSFSTLAQFGTADLAVYLGDFNNRGYTRAIQVPFYSSSGTIVIVGPEEYGKHRAIQVEVGHYNLVLAQKLVHEALEEDEEDIIAIDLFFNIQVVPSSSKILVADDCVKSAGVLLEDAEVAS